MRNELTVRHVCAHHRGFDVSGLFAPMLSISRLGSTEHACCLVDLPFVSKNACDFLPWVVIAAHQWFVVQIYPKSHYRAYSQMQVLVWLYYDTFFSVGLPSSALIRWLYRPRFNQAFCPVQFGENFRVLQFPHSGIHFLQRGLELTQTVGPIQWYSVRRFWFWIERPEL